MNENINLSCHPRTSILLYDKKKFLKINEQIKRKSANEPYFFKIRYIRLPGDELAMVLWYLKPMNALDASNSSANFEFCLTTMLLSNSCSTYNSRGIELNPMLSVLNRDFFSNSQVLYKFRDLFIMTSKIVCSTPTFLIWICQKMKTCNLTTMSAQTLFFFQNDAWCEPNMVPTCVFSLYNSLKLRIGIVISYLKKHKQSVPSS